jgi:hypothetical protein
MYEPVDVIASFIPPEGDKNKKGNEYYRSYSNTMVKVRPLRFKYKGKGINVGQILRTYEERVNGEKVLGYRCFYRQRGFYYHLLFFTQQCKWYIKIEKRQ